VQIESARLRRLDVSVLIVSALSGCIWAIENDGYCGGGSHERGHVDIAGKIMTDVKMVEFIGY
jgi:hypothetical protein